MKKSLILCFFLIILLTSCVNIRKIDYTSYSTSFNETNQDAKAKMLNEVYYSSVNIYSIEDLDKYINNLNNLSKSSYESVKNADYLTYEDLEREIEFQENILKTLKKLNIPEEIFSSKETFNSAKLYKDTNIPDIIKARINYFEVLSTDIELSSITTETNLYQIEVATLPLLYADAERTRINFLENF